MNLFTDIETIPDLSEGALQRCLDAVEPPGQYKKPESIAEWKVANGERIGRENWLRSALDPMCGGIAVVCWATEDGETKSVYREPNESEANMLEAWATGMVTSMTDQYGQSRMPRFIGWNVSGFDLRFLAIRCAIHGIKLPFPLPVNEKFDGRGVCDLMRVWAGFKDYAKQSTVAKALGIQLLDDTDGSELWGLIQEKGISVAVEKCKSDIDGLRQIYSRMSPIFGC